MSSRYRDKKKIRKRIRGENPAFDEAKVIRFLSGDAGRPLTVGEIGDELNIPRPERRSLRAALNRLVASGKLIRIKGGRFVQPSNVHLVTGTVQITGQGDGFVKSDTDSEEVRIPASLLGGAMDSDTVVARVEHQPYKGRKAGGRVIRIVKRARKELVAYYEEDEGLGIAHPQDDRISPAILIPPGMGSGAVSGQLVVVRITTYPEKGRLPRER